MERINIEELGRRLAATRSYRGLSQKEVAAKVGVSQASYSEYEHGKILMGLDKFYLVTHILDVDADWLLGLPEGQGKGPI